VYVDPSRRLPEINSRFSSWFITNMLVGETPGVLLTPTTMMPLVAEAIHADKATVWRRYVRRKEH